MLSELKFDPIFHHYHVIKVYNIHVLQKGVWINACNFNYYFLQSLAIEFVLIWSIPSSCCLYLLNNYILICSIQRIIKLSVLVSMMRNEFQKCAHRAHQYLTVICVIYLIGCFMALSVKEQWRISGNPEKNHTNFLQANLKSAYDAYNRICPNGIQTYAVREVVINKLAL